VGEGQDEGAHSESPLTLALSHKGREKNHESALFGERKI